MTKPHVDPIVLLKIISENQMVSGVKMPAPTLKRIIGKLSKAYPDHDKTNLRNAIEDALILRHIILENRIYKLTWFGEQKLAKST